MPAAEAIHGALMTLGELLRHTGACPTHDYNLQRPHGEAVAACSHCVPRDPQPPLATRMPSASTSTPAAPSPSIPAPPGEFLLARYREVVETVLRFKDSKEKLIRRAVISLLPRLAAFAPERFAQVGRRGAGSSAGVAALGWAEVSYGSHAGTP